MIEIFVYSGDSLVEYESFSDINLAIDFASDWQDNGYKVRVVE